MSGFSTCRSSPGRSITAFVLGLVLRRRALQYLPLAGMVFLAAGIVVFRIELPPSQALALLGSGLTGIGVGATVAPALFVAGFSLAAANLQRVFAIVELLRAVAAFMIAPVFAHFAATVGSGGYRRDRHSALDRGRVSGHGRGVGRNALRAGRGAPAGARHRELPRRRLAGISLAAAAGAGAGTDATARPGPGPRAVMSAERPRPPAGPVVIAYDGSELSRLGIEEAGAAAERTRSGARGVRMGDVQRRVRAGRRTSSSMPRRRPQSGRRRSGPQRQEHRSPTPSGFRPKVWRSRTAPTWKGIVQVAEEHDASVIAIGSHGRSGLASVLVGSVAVPSPITHAGLF